MNKITFALKRQIETNGAKNILYSDFERIFDIAPEFQAVFQELMNQNEDDGLKDNISFAIGVLLDRLYFINQYLYIDRGKLDVLETIYLNTWKRMRTTRKIQQTLRDFHYPQLAEWVTGLYPASFLEPLQSRARIGNVVCREYSAFFQIDCLQMDVFSLKQPLLDIGCGKNAGLVRYLNSMGIEAYGIDRCVEGLEAGLQRIDWFDFSFQPDSWGTILSNMAFSNHFLYAYYHYRSQLNSYFSLFDEICRSLKSGGSFYYAPDLPFAEIFSDSGRYRIEKSVVSQKFYRTRITRSVRENG